MAKQVEYQRQHRCPPRAGVFERLGRLGLWLPLAMLGAAIFAVSPAGEAKPAIRPGAAQPTPTALIELDGTGSESPDGGTMTYLWAQIDGPKVELSDPTAAKPYFRTGKPGLYRFQLTVTANGLQSDPFVVEIMIERDNQPPVAKAPREARGEVGKRLEVDGRESFDPEGGNLTYRWRSLDPNLAIPFEAQGQPVLAFEPTLDGVFRIELVVSDGETVSQPWVTTLMIKPRPRPPVAIAKAIPREIPTAPAPEQAMAPPAGATPVARIEGPAVAKLGERVMLAANGSRAADGVKLEYLWRQTSGPFVSDFELLHDGAAERFKPARAGDYEFELVVSDGRQESAPVLHKLKVVNESEPPVGVVVAPTRAMPGALVKLDATQSYDLEGTALTYRWRQTGGPKVTRYLIDEKIGDAAPAFHPPSAGVYSFELIVSNGRLQSKAVEVNIEVGDARRPPNLSISGPEVANIGDKLALSAMAENAEGRNLSFAWRQVEGPALAMQPANGPRASIAAPAPGRYVFDLSAIEDGKVVASARRTLEVFSPPPNRSGAAQPQLPPPAAPQAPQALPPHPQLTPLLDMPAPMTAAPATTTPSLPPPRPSVAPAQAAPRAGGRPAAQIHPSSLGAGVNFLDPAPVVPIGGVPPL